MSTDSTTKTQPAKQEKPGFIQRIIGKLDASMKEKADAKAQQSCGCSGDGKGGKCC